MSLLLALVTFVLVVISLFMVLVILMQRAKSDGGVGAALGGGMAEAAFGGESANVLTRATQYGAVLFFVLAFALYLGRIHQHRAAMRDNPGALPSSPELMPAAPEPLPSSGLDPSTMPPLEAPATAPSDGAVLPPPAADSSSTPPSENPTPAEPSAPAPESSNAPATTP